MSAKIELTWTRKLPSHYDSHVLYDGFILLHTKRSATNYVNEIYKTHAIFCLDYKDNAVNTFIRSQILLETHQKSRIRLAEYMCSGSTVILDRGDHHAISIRDNKVLLKRLKDSVYFPTAPAYKHDTEKEASSLLTKLFPLSTHYVDYEPLTINFQDEAAVIDGVSIHCYNVDFRIRAKTSSCNIGVEVKTDLQSLECRRAQTLFKIEKYEKKMGAPCIVLIMRPTPFFCIPT